MIPILVPVIISIKALETLERKLLGTRKYFDLIMKGLEGNITTEMGLFTGDMADMIRNSPDLMKAFENEDYRSIMARITRLQGHNVFKEKFYKFMDKYAMRAAGEIDIAKDRWLENPEPLVKSILAIIKTSEEGVHRKDYNKTIEAATAAAEEFLKEVESKYGKIKSKIVKRLVRIFGNVMPIREHPKYMVMKLIYIFKKVFLEEA